MVLLLDLDILSSIICFLDSSSLWNLNNCSYNARQRVQNDKLWLELWYWKHSPISQGLDINTPKSAFDLFSCIRKTEIDVLKIVASVTRKETTINEYTSFLTDTIPISLKCFIIEFLCHVLYDSSIMQQDSQEYSSDPLIESGMKVKTTTFLEHLGSPVTAYIHRIKESLKFLRLVQYGYTLLKADYQKESTLKILEIDNSTSSSNNNITALPMLEVIAETKLFGCNSSIISDTLESIVSKVWCRLYNNYKNKLPDQTYNAISSSSTAIMNNTVNTNPIIMPASLESRRVLISHFNVMEIMNIILDVVIFEENFTGNTADYYNLNNSYIDQVCLTKKGIPLTLCASAQAVAYQLGMDESRVGLIGFPGHVLLGVRISKLSNNSSSMSTVSITAESSNSSSDKNTSSYLYYDVFGWKSSPQYMTYNQLLDKFHHSDDLMLQQICQTFMTSVEIAGRCVTNLQGARNHTVSNQENSESQMEMSLDYLFLQLLRNTYISDDENNNSGELWFHTVGVAMRLGYMHKVQEGAAHLISKGEMNATEKNEFLLNTLRFQDELFS